MAAEQASSSPPQQEPSAPAVDDAPMEEESYQHNGFMGLMAGAMPWVISLLFHVGIFLILIFVVMVVLHKPQPETVIIADANFSENPGGRMNPGAISNRVSRTATEQAKDFTRDEEVAREASQTDKPKNIIGAAGGASGGSRARMGMQQAGRGAGPESNFMGTGGNAHNVVYVIDRSGSMVGTFDHVRFKMLESIGQLKPVQTFHIVLFSMGNPIEFSVDGNKQLQAATDGNKRKCVLFLKDVIAEKQTNPVPALERAFAVLQGTQKPGKLIYLLTDGLFPDNAKVLRVIRENNAGKEVKINTFLYGHQPPEAVKVMERIADENGGEYRYVPSEGY
jgi:hypothetical protein